jgi:ribosomal protein S12 methylthiotransferase
LDRAGFFAYSQEEGTKAGMMKNQLPDTVKQDRLKHISTIQRGISRQINQSYRGKVLDVLVESTRASNGFPIIGRTFRDSPEIDGHIFLTGEDVLPGNFVKAKVTKAGDYDLFGKII